jgi:L-lactate dehydrogenase
MNLTDAQIDEACVDGRNKAYEIISLKGATFHGIAAAAMRVARDILHDRHEIYPVSVYVDDCVQQSMSENESLPSCSYSEKFRTYVSLPAVIARNGVESIVPLKLTHSEEMALEEVAKIIRMRVETALKA